MQALKRAFGQLVIVLALIGILVVLVTQYSFIFSKKVRGQVLDVQRVTQPTAILGAGQLPTDALFSFAVSIRDESGEIFTSSSEDRQWAVIHAGGCVEARFYPYPPWNFEKGGTYFNARMDKQYDCNPANPCGPPASTAAAAPNGMPSPPVGANGKPIAITPQTK